MPSLESPRRHPASSSSPANSAASYDPGPHLGGEAQGRDQVSLGYLSTLLASDPGAPFPCSIKAALGEQITLFYRARPILQMGTPRLRQGTSPECGYTVSKWYRLDKNPVVLNAHSCLVRRHGSQGRTQHVQRCGTKTWWVREFAVAGKWGAWRSGEEGRRVREMSQKPYFKAPGCHREVFVTCVDIRDPKKFPEGRSGSGWLADRRRGCSMVKNKPGVRLLCSNPRSASPTCMCLG